MEGVYIVVTEPGERCLGEMSERIKFGRVRMKCAALASGICLSSTDKEFLEGGGNWEKYLRLGRLLRTSK